MGRRIAQSAGLASLAVIALGLFSWREVAVHYYLARFRSEPKLLIAAIDQPGGSIQAEAINKLVATGIWPAKDVLRYYLVELARVSSKFEESLASSDKDEVQFQIGASGILDFNYSIDLPGWAIHGSGFSGMLIEAEGVIRRLRAIQDLLVDAHFKTSVIPEYPGAEFTFFRKGEFIEKSISPFCQKEALKEACCFVQWTERIRIKEEEHLKRCYQPR
jgi:hypothetical protein